VSDQVVLLAETHLGKILERARLMRAQAVAIDTIQLLSCEHVSSRPGLPAQLRACMKLLLDCVGSTGVTLWLVGHLTQRGDVAGPRTIEHDVDAVLRLDGEDGEQILNCSSKNRFGSISAVGRLKLTAGGFVAVDREPRTS
jgi:DNA repair protein RadA/Sms